MATPVGGVYNLNVLPLAWPIKDVQQLLLLVAINHSWGPRCSSVENDYNYPLQVCIVYAK